MRSHADPPISWDGIQRFLVAPSSLQQIRIHPVLAMVKAWWPISKVLARKMFSALCPGTSFQTLLRGIFFNSMKFEIDILFVLTRLFHDPGEGASLLVVIAADTAIQT